MFKKYLALILSILVVGLSLGTTAFAETKEEKVAKFSEKVKINITKLGTGKDAKVQVKLKDGTKLKGYVSQINENSFIVVDEKTDATIEVPYPQTKQVKGNNLSTGAKVAIIAAGVLGTVLLVSIFARGS